jgi:hypothetical protein
MSTRTCVPPMILTTPKLHRPWGTTSANGILEQAANTAICPLEKGCRSTLLRCGLPSGLECTAPTNGNRFSTLCPTFPAACSRQAQSIRVTADLRVETAGHQPSATPSAPPTLGVSVVSIRERHHRKPGLNLHHIHRHNSPHRRLNPSTARTCLPNEPGEVRHRSGEISISGNCVAIGF